MDLSPILVTVYNRLDHLKRCIDALISNNLANQSILYIASDGPFTSEHNEIILSIRKYINGIKGFRKVVPIIRPRNIGAHNNAIYAFNNIIKKHGRIIFVEDDTITSSNFLSYMNEALNYYENDKRVLTITGYMPPFKIPYYIACNTWLSKRHCNWGFATWKEKWEKVDITEFNRYEDLVKIPRGIRNFNFEGNDMSEMLKNDSDGIVTTFDLRICYHMFLNNQFCLYPRISKTTNIGFDGTGMHCGISDYYYSQLDDAKREHRFDKYMLCSVLMRHFYGCFINRESKYHFLLLPLVKVKNLMRSYIRRILK